MEEATTCWRVGRLGCWRRTRVDPGLHRGPGAATLAAKSESSDDGPVARAVLLHQVGEKAAALADELEEAAARMIVLGEASEMPGQLLDPLRQERDLDFRRSGVTFLGGIPGDDLLLLFPRERHSFLRTRSVDLMSSIYDRRMVSGVATGGKRRPVVRRRRRPPTILSVATRRRPTTTEDLVPRWTASTRRPATKA